MSAGANNQAMQHSFPLLHSTHQSEQIQSHYSRNLTRGGCSLGHPSIAWCTSHYSAPADCSIGLSLPFLSSVSNPGPSLQPPMGCWDTHMLGILVRLVRCSESSGISSGML